MFSLQVHLGCDFFPILSCHWEDIIPNSNLYLMCSKTKREENSNSNDQGPELDEKTDQAPLTNLSLENFLLILEQQENTVTLEANVKIDGLLGGRKEQADSLAKLAWEKMN